MAYNGYKANNGYGTENPFESRDNSFDTRTENPPTYGQSHDVEMQSMGQPRYGQPAPATRDPNATLNECRNVNRAINDLGVRLQELQRLQRGFISGSGASNREIDSMSADIMTGYRGLTDRVRRIKGQPDAGSNMNRAQIDALDRKIKKAINEYQQLESGFRREVHEQQRRQYLIVRPDATEQEIREATEDGADTQIFQQALMSSNRSAQSQSTLRNVQKRHDAIQQIEKTMIELQQLFQDLDAIIVQQDPLIQNIEQKAEETNEHMELGNVEVDKAVVSAKSARRKKWWCLLTVLLIIIVIVIVVAVVVKLMHLN